MHELPDSPRVSAIITTWNAADVLGACLESVERQRVAGGLETIVVDNASHDGTAAIVDRHSGAVRAIFNERNVGFGAANNLAAGQAAGRVLFFLNPDTELVTSDVVETLARTVEQPGVGLAGPMLVNPDGSLQPSCASDPTVTRALLVGAGAHRLMPDVVRSRVAASHWSHDRARDADWVMGAALAVPAELFRELGGFWSRTYAEEQDLAYRVRARGLRVRFEPSAKVMHVGNHSIAKLWSSEERARAVARAELAFLASHYAAPRAAAIRLLTRLGYASRARVLAALGRGDRAAIYRVMVGEYREGSAR